MDLEILKPAQWPRPSGYSNGIAVTGRQVFVAGQVGWNAECRFTSSCLADQVRQALQNICAILAEASAGPEHVVRLTWYVTSRDEYQAELESIGAAYRDVMGKNYPVMSVVQVVALMEAEAKVEIEATAVLPLVPEADEAGVATNSTAETDSARSAGGSTLPSADDPEVEVFDIMLDDIAPLPPR
jgi:enamine deaminase RidA (YjgF/YER057c/UK114 family)